MGMIRHSPAFAETSAFPQYHAVGTNVVVNGGKFVLHIQLHTLDQTGCDDLTIQLRKVLGDLHIMEVGIL